MSKLFGLTAVVALCAVPVLGTAKPIDAGASLLASLEGEHGSTLLLAQAQAPGRPTTPQEQKKPAPSPPNKDPIVKRPPPPPGTPNFPQRPPNNPPLKNPLNR